MWRSTARPFGYRAAILACAGALILAALPLVAQAEGQFTPKVLSVAGVSNSNFHLGPYDRFQQDIDLRTVVRFPVTPRYSVVARSNIPVFMPKPDVDSPHGSSVGVGDFLTALLITPPPSGKLTLSAGPALGIPTATDSELGTGKWLAGGSLFALYTTRRFAVGGFATNVWSVAGDADRADVNRFFLEPILRLQFADGWFAYSTPIISANWEADGKERWTLPLGGGLGRTFKIGDQPVQAQAALYNNVLRPANGAEWTLQAQFTFLFPEAVAPARAERISERRAQR